MKILSLSVLFLILFNCSFAQNNSVELERNPEPEMGMQAWELFVKESINYPESAKLNNIEGTVLVKFFVEKDGSLTDIIVTKGLGHGLDEEAKLVVEKSEKWNPGVYRMSNDKLIKVKSEVVMPIKFLLPQ
ncbi:MAG: energy transducer TonB [Bacteroidota bacterium]